MSEPIPDALRLPEGMLVQPVNFTYSVEPQSAVSEGETDLVWLWLRTPNSVNSYAFDRDGLQRFIIILTKALG